MRLALALLSLVAVPALVSAQPVTVTRADLARTYIRLDALLAAQTFAPAEQRRLNEVFDRGTLSFFLGRGAETIAQLDSVTAGLAPGAWSLQLVPWRVAPVPARVVVGPREVVVRLDRLYGSDTIGASAAVVLRDARGRDLGRAAIGAGSSESSRSARVRTATALAAGRYQVWLFAGRDSLRGDDLVMVAADLDSVAAQLEQRLSAVRDTAATATAIRTARSRLGLLRMEPRADNTAQVLADPVALVPQITSEVVALERGVDPYRARTGDSWFVMTVGEQLVPLRLVVPTRAAGARGTRPLVIALHGAGMDENAFVDGYGVGLITRLAAQYDAVLVSPATNDFARGPVAFDSLVARLARDHMVDPTRVVVIGHSAGAAAAITLGARRPDGIVAIVALAGAGSVPAGGRIPPTSFVGAELDLIIPAARVRASYDQLRAAGHPVQYQSLPNWGHTLMVGAALPEAFRWLFAPERAGR